MLVSATRSGGTGRWRDRRWRLGYQHDAFQEQPDQSRSIPAPRDAGTSTASTDDGGGCSVVSSSSSEGWSTVLGLFAAASILVVFASPSRQALERAQWSKQAMDTTTELYIEPSAILVGLPDDMIALCHEYLRPGV